MRSINSEPELQLIPTEQDTYDSIPLDISDIIAICREYSILGTTIQYQVDSILEYGLQDAIKFGLVKSAALPHIKAFLQQVIRNPYFGDAGDQAADCVEMIEAWQSINPITLAN
jgi:hypothetical protein